MICKTFSSGETRRLGERFAKKFLRRRKRREALILGLTGPLGSGKTVFVRGFFKGLRSKKRVISPTFIFIRRSALRHKQFKNIYHVDLYRLRRMRETKALSLDSLFPDPRNIILIEWAEKLKRILPKNTLWIGFSHGEKENERHIDVK